MARIRRATGRAPSWTTLNEALAAFAEWARNTQNEGHIRPFHFYTASRLVVEGGFHPENVAPRPPFRVERKGGEALLVHDPAAAQPGEDTVFGGLKTKDVDVVVALPRIGPVIAVSMKGTLNAFRNLTNRMEEAAGDCTNIHLAYPGLVYAFWHIMRGTTEGVAPASTPKIFNLDSQRRFFPADVAVRADGGLSSFLARYLFAMSRLSGRTDMRAEPSSYEAVGITFADVATDRIGRPMDPHPGNDSPLHYRRMFTTIYEQYDLRFVYQSPALKGVTQRFVWAEQSPAFANVSQYDYEPRIGAPALEHEEADQMEDETRDS